MQFLIDFCSADSIEKSLVFPLLNCSKHEAAILREIVSLYMCGENEIDIQMFLEQRYYAKGFEVLPYLKGILHLMRLGWLIAQDRFVQERCESALELRNAIISVSPNLLRLLEHGRLFDSDIKDTTYNNSLEYLQDEWKRLQLMRQYNKIQPILNTNLSQSCDDYINNILANIIHTNATKNTKTIKVQQYFKKHHLNYHEKLIFISLAQAQYNGEFGLSLREIVSLGKNEEEKIVLQNLLTNNAKLLKEGIITLFESFSDMSFMEQEFCIPQHVFNNLMCEKSTQKALLEDEVAKSEIFDIIAPKKGLDSVILQDHVREYFEILLQHLNPKVHTLLHKWGIKEHADIDSKILLYGASGTGKTSSAYGLARDLGQKILYLDCSKVLSMYVGESEKNVRKIFNEYQAITTRTKEKPILLLDEADQLLGSRNDIAGSTSRMYHQMQNIFLEQIEKFCGILIATTNLVDSLDTAFSRRFHYKILFNMPDKAMREKIWLLHLPKHADFAVTKEHIAKELSEFNLSGGQIKIIVSNTCYKVATRKDLTFCLDDFVAEVKKEQDGAFGASRSMGFTNK
ncbi:ATP-binding protein [Helicobacter trogontum]|uniref:ATP-binding protein n=1 Tax=Helicobacter trogontum TaxID=50960 RepID=UPI0034E844A0